MEEVDVPGLVCTVPAAQVPSGRQLDWLFPLEYWPAGQVKQTRSTVLEGLLETYVPGAQVDHTVQEAALFTVLNVPLVQAVQVRSLVVVPSLET